LDAADLRRLRRLVGAVQAAGAQGLSRTELLRLAGELGRKVGVTIDFEAASELGQPLIVLRPPAGSRPAACLRELTPREMEVAALLAQGLSNKEVAKRLHISLPTVKDHVHRILGKTGLPSRLAVMGAFIVGDQPNGC
jgi:DNA-binding NarL/FixJ family response regulator